jgi:cytochrome c peroxidase
MFYRIGLFFSTAIIIALAIGSCRREEFVFSEDNQSSKVEVPFGLPPIPWPENNPYTKAKAELGRLLYFDKRLSADGTVSCATCHNLPCGYSDCRSVAIGIANAKGTRHSPTIINSAYLQVLFWDGRAATLEEQCKGPIANPKEMAKEKNAHEAHERCEEKVSEIEGYRDIFHKVFGEGDTVTIDNITKAIATFERTILSGNSPYDRYLANIPNSLTKQQEHGLLVFRKSKCINCHLGVNLADPTHFFNIGVGMDKENPDLGRYAITKDEKDWGAFKVPTLREVELTGPYMHDGSLKTLREVVDFYDKGGIPNKNLHRFIHPLNLSKEDKEALIAFLQSLSGEGWEKIEEPTVFPQ